MIKKRKKQNMISFRIEDDLYQFLQEKMEKERKSLSQIIIDFIFREYKNENKKTRTS
jgi:predicted CopG family antitoxin